MFKTTIPFYNIQPQNEVYANELDQASYQIIHSGNYILGPYVEEFEEKFAQYTQRKHCISVGNGLEAISLTIRALDLDPKKNIITAANSFIASALGITLAGKNVDLVDCNPSYLFDTNDLKKINPENISAIIPVHLYGQMADMTQIRNWAESYSIPIIEDSAQAHGASRDDQTAGYKTAAATYSFYPTKNLGALGDAGCIVTDNEYLANHLKMLRNYGSIVKYEHDFLGTNSRMDALQAAFLTIKLKYLDEFNQARRKIAALYNERLASISNLSLPQVEIGSTHVFHQYVIEVNHRNELQKFLTEKGIATLIHYPIPIHQSKAYKSQLSHVRAPRTEKFASRILSLPIWPGMTEEMIEYICQSIQKFFKT